MAHDDEPQVHIPMPVVVETTHKGERTWDVYSRLLKDRIVFLGTEVNDTVAHLIIAQLLFLESDDPDKEVTLYINSPGGAITAGLAIYDTMQYIRCPVATVVLGQAASMGALLLCAGEAGRRRAVPNARVMIHQPLGGFSGQQTDIEIHAREILDVRRRVNEIMAHHTGQSVEQVKLDTERDRYLSAEEAKAYGLIDQVIRPQELRAEPRNR